MNCSINELLNISTIIQGFNSSIESTSRILVQPKRCSSKCIRIMLIFSFSSH